MNKIICILFILWMIVVSGAILINKSRTTDFNDRLSFVESVLTYENIGKFEDVQERLDRMDEIHGIK